MEINFRDVEFIAGAVSYQQLPKSQNKEFAFWGRSNVGKSSIISSIIDNKGFVRTSKTPGCTRQINLFHVNKKLILADLPGYGYAKVSKSESHLWSELINEYLAKRETLNHVFLLIDSRRGVMESDFSVMRYLNEMNVRFSVVLTKADKVHSIEGELSELQELLMNFNLYSKNVYITSSKNSLGIDKIKKFLLTQ